MATKTKTASKNGTSAGSKLKEIGALIGQERYYSVKEGYNSSPTCAILVRVVDVVFPSCGMKIVVEPVAGVGRFDVCLKELLTREQWEAREAYKDAETRAAQETAAVFGQERYGRMEGYLRDKRVQFQRWFEKLSADEQEKIKEEHPNGFGRLSYEEMKKIVERSMDLKYVAPLGPAPTNDDEDDE